MSRFQSYLIVYADCLFTNRKRDTVTGEKYAAVRVISLGKVLQDNIDALIDDTRTTNESTVMTAT